MGEVSKKIRPGEALDYKFTLEYRTRGVDESTGDIEAQIHIKEIGMHQIWGGGIQWESAVTGSELAFGEIIGDKVTIELITDKIDIDFNDFETGIIKNIKFKKKSEETFAKDNNLYELLFVEDVQHSYDNEVIRITAYTAFKYLNAVVDFNKLSKSPFRVGVTNSGGDYDINFPDLLDVLTSVDEKYLIPIFKKNYGYAGEVVKNDYKTGDDDDGITIKKKVINGKTHEVMDVDGYELERWRYFIDTRYVGHEIITVKDLLSLVAEKFGVFVRPLTQVVTNGGKNYVYMRFCYRWFDKDYLMESAKSLNRTGNYNKKITVSSEGAALYHRPSVHIIDEYFSHNINPKKIRLTSAVHIANSSDGQSIERHDFDKTLNRLNYGAGVIESGRNRMFFPGDKIDNSSVFMDQSLDYDHLTFMRVAKRFRNDASSLPAFGPNPPSVKNGTSVLEYHSGTIDIPLDIYIHPGDALLVNVDGKYLPMLVGSVSANSGGNMTINSPPLKHFATTEEYEHEYSNKNNLKASRDGRDGRPGRDGRDGLDGRDGRDGLDGARGAEGPQGPQGPQGKAATIQVGYTTVGKTASVTNSGTEQAAVFNFVLPEPVYSESGDTVAIPGPEGPQGPKGDQGEQGPPGKAATIRVGSTTVGNYASVTNSGTEQDAVLDFVLPKVSSGDGGDTGGTGGEPGPPGPKGDKGDKGEPGPKGDKGDKGDQGEPGRAATIQVGYVTTGSYPDVTNSGTSEAAVLDFVLPEPINGSDYVITDEDYQDIATKVYELMTNAEWESF